MPVTGWITPAELAGFLRIGDPLEDQYLEGVIVAAQTAIEAHCGRTFEDVGSSESRDFVTHYPQLVHIDPATTVTAVAVDTSRTGSFSETWPASRYELAPVNQRRAGLTDHPYTELRARPGNGFPCSHLATVRVTGTFGWPTRPPGVVQALKLQAAYLHEHRNMPIGVAAGDGFAIRAPLGIVGAAKSLLEPYCRPQVGAF